MSPSPRDRIACLYLDSPVEAPELHAFAEACLRFSPQIALIPGRGLWIEIGKCRRLYSEEGFVKRVEVLAKRFKLSIRIAIHSQAILAYVKAKHQVEDISELPLLSLSDLIDPFEKDPLQRKSLEKLHHALKVVGIRTIPDFLKLPANQLASRFGAIALLARGRLEGQMDIAWPHWAPEEVIQETRPLGYDEQTRNLDPLLFTIRPMLDRVFARLWGRARRLSSLEVKLDFENYQHLQHLKEKLRPCFKFEFLLPQTSSRGTLPILRERMAREFERKPLPASCTGISLRVLKHVPGYEGQRKFGENAADENSEQWGAILSQISEAIGNRGRVFHAVLKPERIPEKAWLGVPISDQKPIESDEFLRIFPKRPSRLLSRPERIEIGRDFVFIRRRPWPIKSWSRPEILTEWLGKPLYRMYRTVELKDRPAIWIFSDEKEVFYLHGYFE